MFGTIRCSLVVTHAFDQGFDRVWKQCPRCGCVATNHVEFMFKSGTVEVGYCGCEVPPIAQLIQPATEVDPK